MTFMNVSVNFFTVKTMLWNIWVFIFFIIFNNQNIKSYWLIILLQPFLIFWRWWKTFFPIIIIYKRLLIFDILCRSFTILTMLLRIRSIYGHHLQDLLLLFLLLLFWLLFVAILFIQSGKSVYNHLQFTLIGWHS